MNIVLQVKGKKTV